MKISNKVLILAGFAMWVAAGPTSAHHSFAMFDSQKTITLDGAVKEFQWTSPHCWIQLVVKDASGKEAEWAVEATSPVALGRNGWKRTSLKPGDLATVVIHPQKDGSNGGQLISVSVNGVQIGGHT